MLTRIGQRRDTNRTIAGEQIDRCSGAVSRGTVRCSTNVDFGTRRPFPRRGFFEPAFAAVTLLTDNQP
jgi:hypothetical protein